MNNRFIYIVSWGCCILIIILLVGNFSAFLSIMYKNKIEVNTLGVLIVILLICFTYIALYIQGKHYMHSLEKKEDEFYEEKRSMEIDHFHEVKKIETLLQKEKERCVTLKSVLQSTVPFKLSASMYSDLTASIYKKEEDILKYKSHPARTAANVVSELKEKTKEVECQYKEMLYKYETLMSLFPELEKYVEDINYIKEGDIAKSIDEVKKDYDRVRDWITADEYKKLSLEEKNQRALDNYLKRKRTPKEIGDDYEMYVGWLLRNKGYETEMFGLKHGLDDLGRDIIAIKKDNLFNNLNEILIIQCKRWSQNKEIHENVICQLFGTTIQYIIKHKDVLGSKIKVYPLLVTTAPLSNTAQKFADFLHVRVKIIPMGEYPRIKCNINNGNKIYHLPFDQQYKTAEIKDKGEFYAFTVKEAMNKGFRRAYKWYG